MLTLDPDRYDAVADRGFEDHACWPITEALLDLAGISKGSALLDVACGTGIVARRAGKRIGNTGCAIGIDLSTGRLEAARRLAERDGLGGVSFMTMDACEMGFGVATFDAVVAQFPHLPDRQACFRGALRILKPGGRIVIGNGGGGAPAWPGTLAPPFPGSHEAIMDGVFDALLREVLPAAAAPVVSGFTQPRITTPDQELREAGFVDIELWSCAHTAVFRNPEDLYAFESTRNSGFRTRVDGLPSADVGTFTVRYLTEASQRFARHGLLGATSGALIAAGRKPL